VAAKYIAAGNCPPRGLNKVSCIYVGSWGIRSNVFEKNSREIIDKTTPERKTTKVSVFFSSDLSPEIRKNNNAEARTAVVTPGTKKASIALGVTRILETRYAISKIKTGILNFPDEKSNEPFKITRMALMNKVKPTPKLRIANLGTEKGFEKRDKTTRGIKKTVA